MAGKATNEAVHNIDPTTLAEQVSATGDFANARLATTLRVYGRDKGRNTFNNGYLYKTGSHGSKNWDYRYRIQGQRQRLVALHTEHLRGTPQAETGAQALSGLSRIRIVATPGPLIGKGVAWLCLRCRGFRQWGRTRSNRRRAMRLRDPNRHSQPERGNAACRYADAEEALNNGGARCFSLP